MMDLACKLFRYCRVVTVQKEFPQAGCYSNKNLLSTEAQVLGVLTSLTLPRRNNSVAHLVISIPSTGGTKTQVPKNPLFDTFTLTLLAAGASTWRRHSGASRAVNSTGHEDIIKMYPA